MPSPLRSTGHVNNTRVTSNTKRYIDPNVSSTGLPQCSVSLLPTYQSSAHIGIQRGNIFFLSPADVVRLPY